MSAPAFAQGQNPQIDYSAFTELASQLGETREQHLLTLPEFVLKASQDQAIILDTRSAEAFRLGHIAGAINLPFSDFTDAKLAKVLGEDRTRPILIYCNNNFSDNRRPIALKRAPLALNIPTFINLHGYGYTNVWELADVVSTADVDWVEEPLIQLPIKAATSQ
ncbi:rhodanese-like domain-containing protein [Parerythrobacter jejuensis]|uniref:Rhodanese-like domain-containing protein n=1 Tax=Parerythrobacter jejuensis TaxID=795812 RepID=A0A845APQ0_9SPHN|nr:rhodanese-like domain-containing protein [Parerythrobacter jejuensis]MXP30466.1 rhodanese-like domain-containing protein [Parerythrobacter jejuensis]MXP33226.1 rhodanese-like domain-containing protein [Parerythrobacter jejuensis]